MIHARHQTTRERIVDAALDLVAAGGIDALSIQALARAVDYTPGALYRYFSGKGAILAALQLEVLATWQARFEALASDAVPALDDEAAALVRVLRLTTAYARLPVDDPGRFSLITEVLGDPRPVLPTEEAEPLVSPFLGLLGVLAAALAAARLAPGDPSRRALVLFGGLQGVVQLRKLERLAPAALVHEPVAPELVTTLLRGWGAPDAALDRALAFLGAPS